VKLKKIVIFFPNFERGGIEKISLLLAEYFISKKIKIIFISFRPLKKIFSNKNKFFVNINIFKTNSKFLEIILSIITLSKVLFKLDKSNTVVFSMQNNIISIIVAKIFGFKIIIRNSAPIDYYKIRNFFSGLVTLCVKIFVYKFSDLIICNSINSANKIKFFFFLKKKTISISNPIEIKKKFKITPKKNIILYIGRLSYEKGVDRLIDGFDLFLKKKPLFKLFIIGSGNQKDYLIEKVKKKNLLKKVYFINWQSDLKEYYLKAKALILPSYFEGFGNVIIEALNYKLPCISTNTDGPSEILKNGKYGLIIKNNSKNSISNGLFKMTNNYNHYKRKAFLGFKENQRYSLDKIGFKYLQSIELVLNKNYYI
jgi:GalNAc-alpha-(1->4)-GalNAc-alpha-(1->3)-diNAcBac-PP-undecaprenol alpha-1,4-N-acetyl-D-galactosaminyltransferase